MMNNAFIIWTPLHLYNAVQFVLDSDCEGMTDAFYICQSEAMKKYYDYTIGEGIFDKVFFTDIRDLPKNQKSWEVISASISPKPFVRHIFGKNAVNNDYEKIFVSVPLRLNDAIIRANNFTEVVGYDDGTGSYVENLYERSLGKKYEKVLKLLNRNMYSIKKVYLNNPAFRNTADEGIEYKKLVRNDLSQKDRALINNIFGYKKTEELTRVIYLNQPLSDSPEPGRHKQKEKEIVDVLNRQLGKDLAIRIHPREEDLDVYKTSFICDNHNLWELICSEEINKENVLIAPFSTAQFTPKLLFDKEPSIIFTFLLYDDYSEEDRSRFRNLINRLRDQYVDCTRIYMPETIEELEGVLTTIAIKQTQI